MPGSALIVDFGGPVLLTPFELAGAAEARLGLAAGRLGWTGPFAPERDPEWQDVLAGRLPERGYWALRGEQFGRIVGRAGDTRLLMAAVYEGTRDGLLHCFESSGRFGLGALSYINLESRDRSLKVQAFHTFPDDYAIVKSQSVFSLPKK